MRRIDSQGREARAVGLPAPPARKTQPEQRPSLCCKISKDQRKTCGCAFFFIIAEQFMYAALCKTALQCLIERQMARSNPRTGFCG